MLIDSYDRVVDYLRVSVTERCNFRCQYCMPEKPFSWVPKENLLSFEELFEFMKIAIDEGVISKENDLLTTRFAKPHDWWFHTRIFRGRLRYCVGCCYQQGSTAQQRS